METLGTALSALPGRENAYVADLGGIDTGRLVLWGYVKRSLEGEYVLVMSEDLSEGERAFMLARAGTMRRMDALAGTKSSCHAFFDRDSRPLTRKIDEAAVRSLMPEKAVRDAFRRLVIPVSSSVARSLGLPEAPVRLRLRQLGLYGLCIDASMHAR